MMRGIGRRLLLGVTLGAGGAEAALVLGQGARRPPRVLARATAKAARPCLEPLDREALGGVFKALCRQLPARAWRADVPMAVSLPDALVREEVFGFADFPKAGPEARALVAMRAGREAGADPATLAVSHEVLPQAEGESGVRVRVRSMPAALRDAVEAAANGAGLHVARLDGWAAYQSAMLDDGAPAGAFLFYDGESWSLTCWASEVQEGFLDSGWHDGPAEALLRRAVRLARSFAMKHALPTLPLAAALPAAMRPALDAAGIAAAAPPPPGLELCAAQVAAWA